MSATQNSIWRDGSSGSQIVLKAGTLNPCLYCLLVFFFLIKFSQHKGHYLYNFSGKLNDWQDGRITISALYVVSVFLFIWLLGFSTLSKIYNSPNPNETWINYFKNSLGFWSAWGGEGTAGILPNFYSKMSYLFINQIFFWNISPWVSFYIRFIYIKKQVKDIVS